MSAGHCQLCSSNCSSFTVAFVRVIMKNVREACGRVFPLACQQNKLSCQQWCWMEALECIISCCFTGWGASEKSVSMCNVFIELYCILFLTCTNTFWALVKGTKLAQGLAYYITLTRYQSRCVWGFVQLKQYCENVKYFYSVVTDELMLTFI